MLILGAALALTLLAALITATALRGPEYTTVEEVLANQDRLLGRPVRVRGWAAFIPAQTVMACAGSDPCCNDAWGDLLLVADLDSESPLDHAIYVGGVECGGDECSLTCTPFDPTSAAAFELAGTLREDERTLVRLSLEEIDWGRSFRLEGAGPLESMRREPIQTGEFAVILREP